MDFSNREADDEVSKNMEAADDILLPDLFFETLLRVNFRCDEGFRTVKPPSSVRSSTERSGSIGVRLLLDKRFRTPKAQSD